MGERGRLARRIAHSTGGVSFTGAFDKLNYPEFILPSGMYGLRTSPAAGDLFCFLASAAARERGGLSGPIALRCGPENGPGKPCVEWKLQTTWGARLMRLSRKGFLDESLGCPKLAIASVLGHDTCYGLLSRHVRVSLRGENRCARRRGVQDCEKDE